MRRWESLVQEDSQAYLDKRTYINVGDVPTTHMDIPSTMYSSSPEHNRHILADSTCFQTLVVPRELGRTYDTVVYEPSSNSHMFSDARPCLR